MEIRFDPVCIQQDWRRENWCVRRCRGGEAARFNMRCTWGERLKATLTFWAVNNFHWGACLAQRFLLAQYWWVFACCFNFHFFLCGFDLQMWITLNGNLFAPKIKTKANFAAEWSALLRFSPCNWQLLAQQRFRLAQTTVAGSLQIPLLDSNNIKAHHQTWSKSNILQPLCVLFGNNYIVSMCFNVIGCRMIRMFEQVMDESWILVWEVWDIAESRGAAWSLCRAICRAICM